MPLGIEPNSIAPQLIANNGALLVQGIRQIGQQISGHLTEMQVKRDLAGLAQETQNLNPESTEFPVQLAQLVTRHPMAARDERGQQVLGILGKAHGQWQAGEAEARAFNRAMAMQTRRTTDARNQFDYEETARGKRPVNIAGVGLVDPSEIDEVTGQAKILAPAAPRMGSNRPIIARPGDAVLDPTGTKELYKNPKPITPSGSEARMQKKQKIDLLMRQDAAARAEFGRLEKRRDDLSQERMKISKADDPNAAYLDNTVKAIEQEAAAIKQRRAELQKAIESIESTPAEDEMEPELGLVPPGAVAPPLAAPAEMIAVIDPNGRPGKVKASQLEAALKNGYSRR